MNFRLDLCIYMDNSLVVFLGKNLLFPRVFVFVKNAKTTFWFWSKLLYQIKIQANTNWSSHLKKHQTFDFFQAIDFLHNFHKSQFSKVF